MAEYIMHHGIKGQKWGVRRYQNEDGTLTAAGKKRLGKMETYRTKLANKAKTNSDRMHARSNEARRNVADLKKNGTKSKAYQEYKRRKDAEREYEYESENSITGEDGYRYVKKYSQSLDKSFNDWLDRAASDSVINRLIEENKVAAKDASNAAKKWMSANENLMNMEVSALTKKREIRKTYRS